MSSKRRRKSRAPSNKSKRRGSSSSLAIPIIVGVAVVAIIIGVIMLRENQQPTVAALPGDVSGAADTALPLSTNPPPNPEVPRASLDGTRDKMEKGEAVLVDVRSKDSYDKAHAAGSISVPEAEVYARLSELPRDKEIVLYCT
jgi:3-mercaptopyruvate sulfurtransferase SseA